MMQLPMYSAFLNPSHPQSASIPVNHYPSSPQYPPQFIPSVTQPNSSLLFHKGSRHPHSSQRRPTPPYQKSSQRQPLKGILKKASTLGESAIATLFKPSTTVSTKRHQARGVTFCLNPSIDRRIEFVVYQEDSTESTASSSCNEKAKPTANSVRRFSSNSKRLKKSEKKKRRRKIKAVNSPLLEDQEDSMAVKTRPGPLSIGLYVFLWIITVGLGIFFGTSEWRSVQSRSNILPLQSDYLPVSCEPSDDNNGRVVHIDCPLRRLHTFFSPTEFSWNVRPFSGLFFEMKVEMFQWVLKSKSLGFRFSGEWTPNLIDSTSYPFVFYNVHINPDFFPHITGAGRRFAPAVYGGEFRLSKKHLFDFHQKRQLTLIDDGYYTAPSERPPTHVTYSNTQVHDNALYTGSPSKPKIGDLKITFWGSLATHVSVIAKQRKNSANGEYELVEYLDGRGMDDVNGANRTVRELLYEGDFTADEMFDQYLQYRQGSIWIWWSIRLGFVFLLTMLIVFTYRIVDTSARVVILPLITGSAFLSYGIVLFTIAPLWLLCDIWRPIIYWIASPISIGIGIFIWLWGRKYTNRISESDSTELAAGVGFLHKRNDEEPSRHFYQPV